MSSTTQLTPNSVTANSVTANGGSLTTRGVRRVLAILVCATIVAPLAACRTRRLTGANAFGPAGEASVTPPIPGAPGPDTLAAALPEDPPAGAPQPDAPPAAEPPAPAPAPTETTPEAQLDEARRAAQIAEEQRRFLVGQQLAKAREAMSAGNIEAAREAYAKALEMDPGNAEALEGWNNLSANRPSSVDQYLKEQRSLQQVRRQEAIARVRSHLEQGRSLESRDEYEGAVAEYNRALAIVSWYDDTSDFGTSAAAVRDLIDNARHKAAVAERAAKEDALRSAQLERERDLMRTREQALGKIQAYFEQANVAFREGRYDVAIDYARQVLRIDPNNQSAQGMIDVAHDAKHMAALETHKRNFDDQWKRVMQQLEFDMLPQVKTVVFPDDWLDGIAQRKPKIVGDEVPADEMGSSGAIYAALKSKRVMNLQWGDDTTIQQAVTYLRTMTGLNFFVTPKAQSEKEEARVPLTVDNVAVSDILDVMTEQNGLKWEVRDGLVRITTADEVTGSHILRFFDINDLQVKIPSFLGQEINLFPSNFTPPEPPELAEPTEMFAAEALQDLIKETIGGPGAWEDPATLEAKKGILIAKNTPEILDQVQKLLDELRANTGLLVNLEVRFLTAEDNFLRDVGVDVRGLGLTNTTPGLPGLGTSVIQNDVFFGSPSAPSGSSSAFGLNPEPSSVGTFRDAGLFYNDGQDGQYSARMENLFDVLLGNPEVLTGSGGLSFQHTFLDDTQMEVILRAVEKSERIQNITSPRITVYNTQRANVQVLNQVSYVQDFEVEIAQASNIANPVIQTIQDGIVLDVRPVVAQNRKFVTLELRPTVAVLTRPIATFTTSLASGPVTANAPVTIQLPELRVSRVRTTVTMPDRGTLLLGGLKFYEQETLVSTTPVLGEIPILSFLFSRKGHYVNRRNLLILITAEIVPLEEYQPKGELDVEPLPPEAFTWTPVREPACGTPCPCPPKPTCSPCGK
jgi:tetratricopeptide (TPR) repeat protein